MFLPINRGCYSIFLQAHSVIQLWMMITLIFMYPREVQWFVGGIYLYTNSHLFASFRSRLLHLGFRIGSKGKIKLHVNKYLQGQNIVFITTLASVHIDFILLHFMVVCKQLHKHWSGWSILLLYSCRKLQVPFGLVKHTHMHTHTHTHTHRPPDKSMAIHPRWSHLWLSLLGEIQLGHMPRHTGH